jgi:MoaD family protein
MTVHFFAHLIDTAGLSTLQIEELAAGTTVAELVLWLCSRFGDKMARQLLNEQGEPLHDDLYVLVNGRSVRQRGGLGMPLESSDQVSIIPVMEAG